MLAAEIHLKKSVVAALGTQNRADLLGVQRQRDRFTFAAVEDGGNFPGQAKPACFVLAARGAGCCFDYNLLLSHTFFPSYDLACDALKRAPALQFLVALAGLRPPLQRPCLRTDIAK